MNQSELLEKTQAVANLIIGARKKGLKIAYLSGKVTGLDAVEVKTKFADDAKALRNKEHFVFNPVEWIEPTCDWQMAMRLCLAVLPLCEVMYKQPDWVDSKGAWWENEVAKRLGLITINLSYV